MVWFGTRDLCLLQVWEIENCLAERELEREEEEERQEGCIGRWEYRKNLNLNEEKFIFSIV